MLGAYRPLSGFSGQYTGLPAIVQAPSIKLRTRQVRSAAAFLLRAVRGQLCRSSVADTLSCPLTQPNIVKNSSRTASPLLRRRYAQLSTHSTKYSQEHVADSRPEHRLSAPFKDQVKIQDRRFLRNQSGKYATVALAGSSRRPPSKSTARTRMLRIRRRSS